MSFLAVTLELLLYITKGSPPWCHPHCVQRCKNH